MLCAIYKSNKKEGMYLYIEKRDNFDPLPEELKILFGKPIFVMLFNLAGKKQLAHIDNQTVINHLQEHGFYLHMPPKEENLFTQWKNAQQASLKA